jgi:uncharacterized membrane protein YeaQ/YmgE (transglycosylase-associated protein family)
MGAFLSVIFSPVTCILWILIGGIAGSIAHQLVGRGRSAGFAPDVVLGLIGAVVGGIVLNFIPGFRLDIGGANAVYNPLLCCGHLAVATFGASVLILIGRVLNGGRA